MFIIIQFLWKGKAALGPRPEVTRDQGRGDTLQLSPIRLNLGSFAIAAQPRLAVPLKSREAREFAEAFHFATCGEGAVLLHHDAHLQVLLEDLIDVLH